MTKAQDTLRLVHHYLYALSFGAPFKPEEAKLMADLCALSLPMRLRWTRDELDRLEGK